MSVTENPMKKIFYVVADFSRDVEEMNKILKGLKDKGVIKRPSTVEINDVKDDKGFYTTMVNENIGEEDEKMVYYESSKWFLRLGNVNTEGLYTLRYEDKLEVLGYILRWNNY